MGKRPLPFIAIMILVLNSIAVAEPKYSSPGTINDDQVRVRALPDTSSEILGKLNRGATVEVRDLDNFQSNNSGVDYWVNIRSDALEGWVFGGLVDIKDKLALPYDTNAGDDLALNSYESSVFAISPKTVLYNLDLNSARIVEFGTKFLLAQGTMISLPPEYEKFLRRKFFVFSHQLESYCVVQSLDDRKLYLVSEKDVSVTFEKSGEQTIYLSRRYIISTNNKFGKQLFVLPKPAVVARKDTRQVVLWTSDSTIDDSHLSASVILALTSVDNLYVCKMLKYGARIGAGGGWTSSVDIMKNINGSLQLFKSLELSHFED